MCYFFVIFINFIHQREILFFFWENYHWLKRLWWHIIADIFTGHCPSILKRWERKLGHKSVKDISQEIHQVTSDILRRSFSLQDYAMRNRVAIVLHLRLSCARVHMHRVIKVKETRIHYWYTYLNVRTSYREWDLWDFFT